MLLLSSPQLHIIIGIYPNQFFYLFQNHRIWVLDTNAFAVRRPLVPPPLAPHIPRRPRDLWRLPPEAANAAAPSTAALPQGHWHAATIITKVIIRFAPIESGVLCSGGAE